MQRQLREHASVANEPDRLAEIARMPSSSHTASAGADSRPTPTERVLHGHFKERFRCSLQRRGRGGVSLGRQLSHTFKQQLEGPAEHRTVGGSARTAPRSPG